MEQHTLSLSYGKDSIACLGAIEELNMPLDRIVHVEVWATDTIPADLPPMIDFKAKADEIIKKRWGIEVEHISSKPYEHYFYTTCNGKKSKNRGMIYGFPLQKGNWCNNRLKTNLLKQIKGIQYIGIAADEPNRFHNLNENKISPLLLAGWTEQKCREWCEENDLLSPIYTTAARGGCWFCHNQSVQQLRLLRKNYPKYWQLLLKWDNDSFVKFKSNATVHDYDKRFELEDKGLIEPDEPFFWKYLEHLPNKQLKINIEI